MRNKDDEAENEISPLRIFASMKEESTVVSCCLSRKRKYILVK